MHSIYETYYVVFNLCNIQTIYNIQINCRTYENIKKMVDESNLLCYTSLCK